MSLEKINEIRKRKKITIEALAQQSGVPVSTIAKICSGRTKAPKLDTLKAIAKTLDCPLNDFDDAPFNEPMVESAIEPIDIVRLMVDFSALSRNDQVLLVELIERLRQSNN